jgi:plasmid stabilization system protein ParE
VRRIEWSEQASLDIEDVADFYGDFDPTLPDTMIRRIAEAARPLLDNPRLGPTAGESGLRKWHARRTSFLLLYVVRGDTIHIARVVHAASDWQSML